MRLTHELLTLGHGVCVCVFFFNLNSLTILISNFYTSIKSWHPKTPLDSTIDQIAAKPYSFTKDFFFLNLDPISLDLDVGFL